MTTNKNSKGTKMSKKEKSSDQKIEEILAKNGFKWNGDVWEVEDADLIPAMKALIEETKEKTLKSVVLDHISDLLSVTVALEPYKEMQGTKREALLAIKELNTALRSEDEDEFKKVVRNHIKDLEGCVEALNDYKEFSRTQKELKVAISELSDALKEEKYDKFKLKH